MFEKFTEGLEALLDRAEAYVWDLFEKDMQTVDAVIRRTEWVVVTLGHRVPARVRRLFNCSL